MFIIGSKMTNAKKNRLRIHPAYKERNKQEYCHL